MKYSINLFPGKELNFTDKVVYFMFHYLRYILVITQFVVICVFFYRFKVDQEIVDLKDTINQKVEIVKSTNALLKEVEMINKQVQSVNTVLNKQTLFQEMYAYFYASLPTALTLTSTKFTATSIDCLGITPNVESVRLLYEKLKKENRFQKVELKNVNKSSQGYTFSLQLTGYSSKNL